MAEDRPIYEEFLDLAVYGPLGLALTVIEDLPQVIEKGRARLAPKITVAKMVGRVAIAAARVATPSPSRGSSARDQDKETTVNAHVAKDLPISRDDPESALGTPVAISDYDTLAASQVVKLLDGLTKEERASVRAYEQSNRHRLTVLNKLDQLDQDQS